MTKKKFCAGEYLIAYRDGYDEIENAIIVEADDSDELQEKLDGFVEDFSLEQVDQEFIIVKKLDDDTNILVEKVGFKIKQ